MLAYIVKGIVSLGMIELIIQGFTSISGIIIVENLMSLKEVLTTVGKIAIFLGGAYVMLEIVKRVLIRRVIKVI